jgi:hypothetical protein
VFNEVKQTGKEYTKFATGSQRDNRVGKGRFDLLSPIVERRDAVHMENGARKYNARNWELGQTLSTYLDSAKRHLADFLEGKRDEDHLAAARWNIGALMHTEEMIRRGLLPAELDDLPNYIVSDDPTGPEPRSITARQFAQDHLGEEPPVEPKSPSVHLWTDDRLPGGEPPSVPARRRKVAGPRVRRSVRRRAGPPASA